MLSRRVILTKGLQLGAGFAIAHTAGLPHLCLAQQTTPPPAPDEMTLNSAVHNAESTHVGPPPPVLPKEALAVRGKNSLQAHARRHGLLAGAAVVVKDLDSDPAYRQLITQQYGILVPENELKWRALRPTQDRFDFSQSDALFTFAAKHRIQVRGHTFVWHNSVPDWLKDGAARLDVRQLLVEHIRTVCTRYKGRVHSWDVVNEAILPKDGQAGGLRKSFWFENVGPDYIDLAFRTARAADPHALLTYNDYGVEYDNDDETERRARILELLQGLRKRDVPLDAVGIQSHIKAGSPSRIDKGLASYMESIRKMGLQIFLTEMDVNEDDLKSDDVTERDAAVASTYANFLTVALANPAVKAVLTWGVSDRRTWLNDGPTHHRKQPNRPQRSLPFDNGYRPSKAFFAIRDSFDHRSI